MTDLPTSENCPRCGGTTSKTTSGSITQWMVRCTCGAFDGDEPVENLIEICGNCNKRIGRGREGSFTQWIFRNDICSCESPEPHMVSAQLNSQQNFSTQQQSPPVESPEEEIKVDPDKFPIERYKPIAILGEGAAGSVYLCRDRMLAKKVAIKILKILTKEQLIAFQKEAKAASKLRHRNVVSVHDFGATPSGHPFMVMEFFNGDTLADVLKSRGVLDEPTALSVFAQVCDGLSESHKNGIFHRDIKSTNILVDDLDAKIPDVRIIDFGVAGFASLPDHSQTAQSETFVGTPQYMSPDQARGLKYDARSEIYSIGCTMFEALTGDVPFNGATALEVIHQHANSSPPTLSKARPDLSFSIDIENIVAKCLEKEPTDRFASASELGQSLRNVLVSTHPVFFDSETEQKSVISSVEAGSKQRWIIGISLAIVTAAGMLCVRVLFNERPTLHYKSPKSKVRDFSAVMPDLEFKSPANSDDGSTAVTKYTPDTFQSVPDVANFRWKESNVGPFVTANRYVALSDANLAQLKDVKHIRQLELGGSLVSGTGMKYLENTTVYCIDMWNTPLNDAGMQQISKTKGLQVLVIGRSDHLLDSGLKWVADMPMLSVISYGGRNLTDKSLQYIAKSKSISTVEMCGIPLTKQGVDALSKMTPLKSLVVKNSQISDDGYDALRKLPRALVQFEIDDRTLTDREVESISHIRARELLLSNCRITSHSRSLIFKNPAFLWRGIKCDGEAIEDRYHGTPELAKWE